MNFRTRVAFTLIELMAALVVISILAAMTMAALSAAAGSARLAKSRAQTLAVQEVLLTRMEEYITRRTNSPGHGIALAAGYSVRGPEASRLRLEQLRQLLRFELPDRKSDLYHNDGSIVYGPSGLARPTFQRVSRGYALDTNNEPPPVMEEFIMVAPPAHTKYINLIHQLVGASNAVASFANWSEKYEGSETLYLILATTQIGGRSGLEVLPSNQIADTDGDGVPEVLDPWGTPMVWIRWPVGYVLTYAQRNQWPRMDADARQAAMETAIESAGKDQFDILESDWRNLDNIARNDTFNITPLVVSAGPDREFDLMLRSQALLSDGSVDSTWNFGSAINYGFMTWPTDGRSKTVLTYGNVTAADIPYEQVYYYADPYAAFYHDIDYINLPNPFLKGNETAGLPGAYYDANDDGVDDSTDNVFSVRAE